MPKPQVFIDTNVWFSAFYGSPNASEIVKRHILGKIQGVISQKVLEEIVRNVAKKLPNKTDSLKRLLESTPPKIIKSPQKIDPSVKKFVQTKDREIFQAAVDSKSDWFVTGNLKDFDKNKSEDKFKIKIASPKEFLKA